MSEAPIFETTDNADRVAELLTTRPPSLADILAEAPR